MDTMDPQDEPLCLNLYQHIRLLEELATLDSDARLFDTKDLSALEQVAIFVMCCSGHTITMASDFFDVTKEAVWYAFFKVRNALLAMYDDYVKPPTLVTTAASLPELQDDARFKYFGSALQQIVGAVTIVPIGGHSRSLFAAVSDSPPSFSEDNSTDTSPERQSRAFMGEPAFIGTSAYTGPQHAVLMFSIHGTITAVYAPGYANAGSSYLSVNSSPAHDVLTLACLAGARELPPLPPGTRLLAPPDAALMLSSRLPLMGAFTDAKNPPTPYEQDAIGVADGAHALFNVRHAQLYDVLAERPLRQLRDRFRILDTRRPQVSAATLKALCVLHNFVMEVGEGIKLEEESDGEGVVIDGVEIKLEEEGW